MALFVEPSPEATIARAAALLEAVARVSGDAVDADVPIRCGLAADTLHRLLGAGREPPPFVVDGGAVHIRAAISDAITALTALPTEALTDAVLDAVLDARSAAAAAGAEAVP
jgi:hypothetical protein